MGLPIQCRKMVGAGPVQALYSKSGARVCKRTAQLVLKIRFVAFGKDVYELNNQAQNHIQRILVHIQVAWDMRLTFQQLDKRIKKYRVIMQIAIALETTPDEFLVGAVKHSDGEERWRAVAELLRDMDDKQLDMARCFLLWLSEQE